MDPSRTREQRRSRWRLRPSRPRDGGHRFEDACRPDTLAVEQARGQRRSALQGPGDGQWVDVSYAQLGEIVKELSLGLQELGIERAATRSASSPTRAPSGPTPTSRILCAGATVVPIYQTNSPEECEYVLNHSESKAVIVEDAEQLEKIREVRDQLPTLEHVISIEPIEGDDVITIRGRCASAAAPATTTTSSAGSRGRADRRRHLHLHLGHHRAAEGLHHRPRQLARHARHDPGGGRAGRERGRLPLPAARARLRAPDPARRHRRRRDDRLLGEGPAEDHPQPARGQADLLPERAADLREDLRDRDRAVEKSGTVKKAIFNWAVRVGRKVRELERQGKQPGPLLQTQFDVGRQERALERPQPVRRQHQAVRDRRRADLTGDPRVLLGLRRARAGGLRHDRDLDRRHDQQARGLQVRLGRQALPRRAR